MAAIVDTDVLHKILASRGGGEGDSIFRSWIEGRQGILVYAVTDAYKNELKKNDAVMVLMERYRQGGHAKLVEDDGLSRAKKQLRGNEFICSNDIHVLALALAGGALVLCSRDNDLGRDFRNKDVLPKIGRKSRALYPVNARPATRKKFLNRRQCPNPQ